VIAVCHADLPIVWRSISFFDGREIAALKIAKINLTLVKLTDPDSRDDFLHLN
jgi:hypothetical protein